MNEKQRFNLKPNTMPLGFCFPTRIRINGSNYYVEGICSPSEDGAHLCHIMYDNGKILRNVNPKTDFKIDIINILLADGVVEYLKDRNGNYTNQDQESREFRDATNIIAELNTKIKQLEMDKSRLSEESKSDDFINKETKKMGTSLSNIRGGAGDRDYNEYNRLRPRESANPYSEEPDELDQQSREEEQREGE